MKKIIKITACSTKECGDSIDATPWWGSKEGIAAGENKRTRVMPITVGKSNLKKAA